MRQPGFLGWLTWFSDLGLCVIRKWWRPTICASLGLSLFVNGVVLPIMTRTFPDLTGLSLMVAAASPFAWLRSHEKIKGVA